MLSLLSACSFIYITMDSQDSYCIHVHLYLFLSQCTDSRERTPAPLITGSSSLSPVPRPSQAARTVALQFSVSFWPPPRVSPHSFCTGPRWSLVTPRCPPPTPGAAELFWKAFSTCVWQGFAVLRQCFWLGSEHLCCPGVCVCPFVCTLLRVHSILWLTGVVGFRKPGLHPVFSPPLGFTRWALSAMFCVLFPVSSILFLRDLQPGCVLHSVLITDSFQLFRICSSACVFYSWDFNFHHSCFSF